MVKLLEDPKEIIPLIITVIVTFGAIFYNYLPVEITTRLYIIYFASLGTGFFIGTYVFKFLKIDPINDTIEKLDGTTDNLRGIAYDLSKDVASKKLKDLIEKENIIWSDKKIKQITVFGVTFELTSGIGEDSKKERKMLLGFLEHRNKQGKEVPVTYIVCPKTFKENDYDLIPERVKNFLTEIKKEKNFSEILDKIEIYRIKTNPFYARAILLERYDKPKQALYQISSFGSKNLESKIRDWSIRIDYDEDAVPQLFKKIEDEKNNGDLLLSSGQLKNI